MRDEVKNRDRPWQLDMPFLNTPTQTAHSHKPDSGKAPAITSSTGQGTSEFALGIDTCGFTFGSTGELIHLTDQRTYRGCCVPGASDCSSTIHTSCIDYGLVDNSAECGPRTLCCPWTAASCFSYAFTTDTEPDATFTYVQCQQSRGFGELYPQPPELTTDTPPETSSESPTSLTVQPEDNHRSSSSTPAGAIAGAVCGSIVFICLIIAAVYMLMRRRRIKRQQANLATMSTEPARLKDETPEATSTDGGATSGAGGLRPLSTIPEQGSPTGSPLLEKRKSAFPRVQSLEPNWPLGANGNPLASHPVDLEKRLSRNTPSGDQTGAPRPPSQQIHREPQSLPMLKVPTPPPGSRLAPPPPPPKSPRTSSASSPRTPTSTGAMVQSPRLSFVPVSPIEVAFDEEMDQRKSWFDDSSSTGTPVATSSGIRDSYSGGGGGLTAPRAPTPGAPILSLQGLSNTSATDFAVDRATDRDPDPEPVSPVSPLDVDDDGNDIGTRRLSFISVPSVPGDGDREVDDLVSPISPNDPRSADGRASPETVSPLESRQGSLRGR
ncbi:hypothetical protein F4775DRAFT_599637 [Biscogniauxia sp. FL1348]|nr:hypothetical protein F4775DRAFT_599637 [Biscogniauxia sp. FL1348]